MPVHTDFIASSEKYAASFDKPGLAMAPAKRLIVVACMDARVDPASQLGIDLGDAHIIQNAGGLAKEALRSIIISQRLLGANEIAVFHHTDCGMLRFTNDKLREKVKSEASGDATVAGLIDDIDFLPFSNLEESVKADVKFLNENPLVPEGTIITGWIYDVDTGKSKQIV